jgi:tetratricopeptide (TPR) repeat protein
MRPHHLSASLLLLLAVASRSLVAQQGLPIKRAISGSGVGGCSAAALAPGASSSPAPNADAESRRLIADAQEAVLQGEHATARDAFARAAALVPGNARVAYYLAREHEALNENPQAVKEYCRYLGLSPSAADADEVRGRVVRLTPPSEIARGEEARASFRAGVALLQRRQYVPADSAFGVVIRQMPAAPEAYFNRALARAARGSRPPAIQDFERYLELAPQAADRQAVRTAMTRLQDRVYGSGSALTGLLLPGLGQMSTGRPVLGVVALGLSGTAIGIGAKQVAQSQTVTYTDPFGNQYTDVVSRNTRPNAGTWMPIAGVIWLGAAFEALRHAGGSRKRAEAIIASEGPATPALGLVVAPLPRGRMGIGLNLSRSR